MKILNKIKQFWNKYNLIIKLLLSLCILYFVFVNLNISQVLSLLKEINVLFLIPCLFLAFVTIVFIYATIEKWIKKKICNLIKNELFNKIIFESQRTKKELIMHSFYCLIIILLQVIIYHLIFSAVGFEVKTIELFILIPLLTIALVLPISFQGFGIREFLFIEFAKWNLVLPEKALIASFLLYLIELIYRLFGAIPFLILKKEN